MLMIERIYYELEKQNLKASALCSYIGISTAQLSTWKKRGTDPKAIYIPKIAEFLNVSQNYIITGEEKEWKPTLSEKERIDIGRDVQATLNALDSKTGLMFDGEILDEETKEYLESALKTAFTNAKIMAKEKYTPNKYRK